MKFPKPLDGLHPVFGFRDHHHVAGAIQDRDDTFADDVVILSDQHADLFSLSVHAEILNGYARANRSAHCRFGHNLEIAPQTSHSLFHSANAKSTRVGGKTIGACRAINSPRVIK